MVSGLCGDWVVVASLAVGVDRVLLESVTSGEWQVELVESSGLWETRGIQTLMFLPPFLGPSGSMLVHRLAYTFPTRWTTEDLGQQLGLPGRRLLDSLARAADYEVLFVGSRGIEVPDRLGPLPSRHLRKLTPKLRDLHDRLRYDTDHQ